MGERSNFSFTNHQPYLQPLGASSLFCSPHCPLKNGSYDSLRALSRCKSLNRRFSNHPYPFSRHGAQFSSPTREIPSPASLFLKRHPWLLPCRASPMPKPPLPTSPCSGPTSSPSCCYVQPMPLPPSSSLQQPYHGCAPTSLVSSPQPQHRTCRRPHVQLLHPPGSLPAPTRFARFDHSAHRALPMPARERPSRPCSSPSTPRPMPSSQPLLMAWSSI
jgi:hypothetical protein